MCVMQLTVNCNRITAVRHIQNNNINNNNNNNNNNNLNMATLRERQKVQ